MIKQLAAIGAIGLFSTCLFAQGLNTNQTKDQWEESISNSILRFSRTDIPVFCGWPKC
jgi:hypothetical protein